MHGGLEQGVSVDRECIILTNDDPEDDGVAQDGGDHDQGEAASPDNLVSRPEQ